MNLSDPDELAQELVLQWLHENGYQAALEALQRQLGKLYDDAKLPEASQLMQLVWRHLESSLEDGEEGGAEARKRAARQAESERLLRAGSNDYAREVLHELPPEVHRSNVIAVRVVPGEDAVITAAGDSTVRKVRFDGGVEWEARLGCAALLCLALHPHYGCGTALLAVGSMDGSVSVLHGPTGRLLARVQAHSKYVVRVAWQPPQQGQQGQQGQAGGQEGQQQGREAQEQQAGQQGEAAPADAMEVEGAAAAGPGCSGGAPAGPSGAAGSAAARSFLLATASTDETVGLHVLRLEAPGASGDAGGEAAAGAAAAGPDGGEEPTAQMVTAQQLPYGAAVHDVAFLRGSALLVVAVRGSNYLRLVDTRGLADRDPAGAHPHPPESRLNMNEAGDDHVSFSAKQLLPSPCGAYLLVCTDTPRMLLLRTEDWSQLRVLFGPPVDTFPQPAAAWHRDSNYVYAAAANAQLCVFHVGSGRLLHTSRHHKINVRDVDYDPARNLLATCSFDKTVKLLGYAA